MKDSKNYLVIGGSSGIGKELADVLKNVGHDVTCASRSENADIHLDVLKDDLIITKLPEQLDGIVYCPGSINLKPISRLTDEDFRYEFEINVMGFIKVFRTVLPLLKKSESSSIVLFSTVAVQQGMPYHSSTASAKGALEGICRSLAAELAPRIRVNCIAPSLVNTPLASKLLSTDEKIKSADERHPLKRIGKKSDIANLAAFLLSSEASWITGQVIHADGGLSTLRI